MSLSTLIEAAKYLDYLDSNKNGQAPQNVAPHQQHLRTHTQQTAPSSDVKKSSRRQRSSRKDAANTMIAMSLPANANLQMQHGMPIPTDIDSSGHHNNHYHQTASLSSSFTTGSPLSSFASTALLCSKASCVTSASSSTASSLSSSDSSSSCGEILMNENDFNQSPNAAVNNERHTHHHHHQMYDVENHLTRKLSSSCGDSGADTSPSFARYIAATSSGPQLVTMTATSAGLTSTSAPMESCMRTSHVIQAASNNMLPGFDARNFSIATTSGGIQFGDSRPYGVNTKKSLATTDVHLNNASGNACPPLIMARVQPIILNSLSQSTHQGLMAFQSASGTSPTSSSSSYSRHRELHKTLEKNRRAHLRHCFELLKTELPTLESVDKKTSHINIIKSAIRFVLALRQQESEIDNELQRLTKRKNELTEKLSRLSNNNNCDLKQRQNCTPASSLISTAAVIASTKNEQTSTSSSHQQTGAELQNQHKQQAAASPTQSQQQPAEQQLSFLLSQSKIKDEG